MLPSSLPLPHLWNFLLPLPAPDKISRFRFRFRFQFLLSKCFRFHKNLTAYSSTSVQSMKQLIVFSVTKKQATLFCKLFYLTCVVDRAWYGMEDDFSIFHTGNFLPFHFRSILKIFHSIFHSLLNFLPYFIPYFHTKELLDWKQCNVYFAALHVCNAVSNHSWRCVNNTTMQQPVSGMHIACGLMHRRSQDFGLEGGLNRKSHAMTSSKIYGTKNERSKAGGLI